MAMTQAHELNFVRNITQVNCGPIQYIITYSDGSALKPNDPF